MLMDSERSVCRTGEKEMGMAVLVGDTMGGRAANAERWLWDVENESTDVTALGGVTPLGPAPPLLAPPLLPIVPPLEPACAALLLFACRSSVSI